MIWEELTEEEEEVCDQSSSLTDVCLLQKNTVKTLFGGVITNNVVSLVSLRTVPLLVLLQTRMSVVDLL